MGTLRFSTFRAPIHSAGEHPTVALQRDLDLVEHLDKLCFDEDTRDDHFSKHEAALSRATEKYQSETAEG